MISEVNAYLILDYYNSKQEYCIHELTNKIKTYIDDIQFWIEEIKMITGSIQNILDNLIHSVCIKIPENTVFNYASTLQIYQLIKQWLANQYLLFNNKAVTLEEFSALTCCLLLLNISNLLEDLTHYVTENYRIL